MCSSESILLGEERAFEVDSRDPSLNFRKSRAGLRDRSQAVNQLVDGRRDQGRAEPSCPEMALVADDRCSDVNCQVGSGKRMPVAAIQLDVPEGGRDPFVFRTNVRGAVRRPNRFNELPAQFDLNPP